MFKKAHRFFTLGSIVMIILIACSCKSNFERLRESNDIITKYQTAKQLYYRKDYNKALILFEDLVQRYRGQVQAEEIFYFYAYTNYKLKDYLTARYNFKVFAETYPHSDKAEECRYMVAKCYYLESPTYSLDQQNTVKALEALQLFINLYPKSSRVKEATKLIADLRYKLETKSYANAKLFLDIGNYKSAILALKNSLRDYPDTKYTEDIEFLVIKAQYLLAKNSLESKQEMRFTDAIETSKEFLNRYPSSKYVKIAKHFQEESQKSIALEQKKMSFAKQDEIMQEYLKKEGKN